MQTYSENVKTWLIDLYNEGARTNKKLYPKKVAKCMETEQKNGKNRFFESDLLNWRQIASFWSRRQSMLQRLPADEVGMQDNPTTEGDADLDFEVQTIVL